MAPTYADSDQPSATVSSRSFYRVRSINLPPSSFSPTSSSLHVETGGANTPTLRVGFQSPKHFGTDTAPLRRTSCPSVKSRLGSKFPLIVAAIFIVVALGAFFANVPFELAVLFKRPTSLFPSNSMRKTNILMTYINLDRSTHRKANMEKLFGSWGRLVRTPALNASNIEEFTAYVDTHGLSPQEYATITRAPSAGMVGLCASTHRAIKNAVEQDEPYLLFMEDDMSDILVPYWRWSLDEIVAEANAQNPSWHIIQLHLLAYGVNRQIFHAWKYNMSNPFVPRPRPHYLWGGGANLISRLGMEKFLEVLSSDDGRFDCWNAAERDPKFLCLSDFIYWQLTNDWLALLRVPPMFTYLFNEGSTRVRLTDEEEKGKEKGSNIVKDRKGGNDKALAHYQSIFDSLQANMEAQAAMRAAEEFGEENIDLFAVRYMENNIYVHVGTTEELRQQSDRLAKGQFSLE